MQYLVTMEFVEVGMLISPPQLAQLIETTVLPGFDFLIAQQAEGKIVAGGIPAGSRNLSLIIEAASNDELDALIHRIPFWGVMKTVVTPLQSFANRAAQDRALLAQINATSNQ
jgi:muconolactone delta-isomerase